MRVVLRPDKVNEARIAHLPGVTPVLLGEAEGMALFAGLILASTENPRGRHEVWAETGDVDAYVVMAGPAPLTVEFGRKEGSPSGGMEPIAPLTTVLGQAAS